MFIVFDHLHFNSYRNHSPKNKSCHNLLPCMSFLTCVPFFLLRNTIDDILNIVANQIWVSLLSIVWIKNISQNIFSYVPQKKVTLFGNDLKMRKVTTEFKCLGELSL